MHIIFAGRASKLDNCIYFSLMTLIFHESNHRGFHPDVQALFSHACGHKRNSRQRIKRLCGIHPFTCAGATQRPYEDGADKGVLVLIDGLDLAGLLFSWRREDTL